MLYFIFETCNICILFNYANCKCSYGEINNNNNKIIKISFLLDIEANTF